ncbi:MAG: sugar phosphate isomerase/epimerase [Bacteroidetes bacterium]|nr:sugar phosphate isomerase/epimerase [Bacteroidota bacterium]
MAQPLNDFSRLCVHTQTTKPWDIDQCISEYSKAGIYSISIWRHLLENKDLKAVKAKLEQNNMEVISLVRGGFFPNISKEKREQALQDNITALYEAQAIGAPLLVLVCGADPNQSLEKNREQITTAINALLPLAEQTAVKMAIEPLHPMYAGDKSAVTTLEEANTLAEIINSPWVGVAVDVYHLWWDQHLEQQIKRCGKNNHLFAFHVCDWLVPTRDMLTDRGLMGEGCIELKKIRSWVENAGFLGKIEVEVFSERLWNTDQKMYLEQIKKAYLSAT